VVDTDLTTIANERHCVAAKIPEDRAEGFQPLDSEHHVVGAKCETIAVDVEDLVVDRHLHCVAASRTHESVAKPARIRVWVSDTICIRYADTLFPKKHQYGDTDTIF
jgi:hypothetical protein